MNDTTPLMQQKTPQERMNMGFSMCNSSRKLVLDELFRRNPNADSYAVKKHLLYSFYGQDFTKEKLDTILKHIAHKI